MLLSRKLLNDINPIFKKISDDELSKILNKSGIEVEKIIKHHQMNGLVICYIEEVSKHPNADKLSVASVSLSSRSTFTVVCGAKNIQAGKYAIYAPVGTIFQDGKVIEQKNIRGVDSSGMLCGYSEITNVGLENMSADDADGIILFDKAKLGDTNIAKYINNDDVIFDLSIPSNRNDLNSVFNLEQELCFSMQAKSLLPIDLVNDLKRPNFKFDLDNELCSDIGFIHIQEWPKYKTPWTDIEILTSSGYKIHNNVLDLMNMFSLVFGNPIHVYDAKEIDFRSINVKLTTRPIKFAALDKKIYDIPSKTIGIYNKNELINIAGIIGSEKHMYNKYQKSIIIEIGNFNSNCIRNTAQKMKINTKAQSFFAKPFSGWITQYTYISILKWLKERKIKFKYSYSFTPIQKNVIPYKRTELLNFIGVDNFKYKSNDTFNDQKYYVHPTRIDIKNKYDVYEEIMKIIDINTLIPKPINFDFKYSETNQSFNNLNKLKNSFVNFGLIETKTYNLSSENNYNKFNFWNNGNKIVIANPISKNREILRISLIDEMLKVIQYNIARKRQLFNIFETQLISNEHNSHMNLGAIFCCPLVDNKINGSSVNLNIITLKSLIRNAFNSIAIELVFKSSNSHIGEIHNNQFTRIYWNDQVVGYIGKIKNSILKQYDINEQSVFAVSINIDDLIMHKNKLKIKKISNFPAVYRDINVILKNQYDTNDLIYKIKSINFVNDCWIKDVFKNDSNNTTYTFAIKISSLTETLQTSKIDEIISNIKKIIGQII